MKVIFVIASMAGGGSERVISILANRFVKQGIDVSIVMTASTIVDYELDPKVKVISAGDLSQGSMYKRFRRIKNIRKVFKETKGSVIVSFGPGTSFYAVVAAVFLKHPFIISERNDPAACPVPRLRNIFYRHAERLVFQTKDAMESFPMSLQKKGCIIPNPIKAQLPDSFLGEREKKIVAVGRLEKQKNYFLLLEAFHIFSQKYPEYTLHIYGKGTLQDVLRQETERLDLADKVKWEGFKPNVLEEIRKAGIFAISSDYEGISNAMIEAMALGLPVVATDCPIGGAAFCIRSGENGILVPCGDKESMADAFCRLANNPKLANDMGIEAMKVREIFAEENICEQWLEQIRGII